MSKMSAVLMKGKLGCERGGFSNIFIGPNMSVGKDSLELIDKRNTYGFKMPNQWMLGTN